MREIKALKLNLPELVMKGLQFITKAESAGDACTMTDGSAGVLAEDPDNAGQLIRVPAEKTQKEREAPNDPELDNSQAQVWRSKTARFCSQDCYLSHEKQRLGL